MKKLDFIFDTDVGSDCDDMMALTYLVYAKRNLNLNLKAVTYSHNCPHAIAAIKAFFKDLGEEIPPIGRMPAVPVEKDNYSRAVAQKYATEEDYAPVPDAVSVLRRALAESEGAILCAVGPFTNVAALLNSQPDEISPLDGVSLVREKCAKVVVMGGRFTPEPDGSIRLEWNALVDPVATKAMAELCPVPMVFSPFELGWNMITGGPIMEKYGTETPLSMAFVSYSEARAHGGRHSWDPATAVYAIEGEKDFFKLGNSGTVTVDAEGRTFFTEAEDGLHTILSVRTGNGLTEQQSKDRIAAYIDDCSMQVYER